jgi:hypothetical protein
MLSPALEIATYTLQKIYVLVHPMTNIYCNCMYVEVEYLGPCQNEFCSLILRTILPDVCIYLVTTISPRKIFAAAPAHCIGYCYFYPKLPASHPRLVRQNDCCNRCRPHYECQKVRYTVQTYYRPNISCFLQ